MYLSQLHNLKSRKETDISFDKTVLLAFARVGSVLRVYKGIKNLIMMTEIFISKSSTVS